MMQVGYISPRAGVGAAGIGVGAAGIGVAGVGADVGMSDDDWHRRTHASIATDMQPTGINWEGFLPQGFLPQGFLPVPTLPHREPNMGTA